MNRLNLARRTQIINCLVEGNSIRSTERMTDTHRDTVMRLLVEVGEGCKALLDVEMRDLTCRRIQIDEIWAYVGKKQRQVAANDDRSRVGDQWTFVALDPDTKLVPAFRVGKRNLPTATAFLTICRSDWQTVSSSPPTPSRPTWMPLNGHSVAMSITGRR